MPDSSGVPVALVYRGPATNPGCAAAVAALLRDSAWGFDVRYVGPAERTPLTADVLSTAMLYAQPGGGELDEGYRHMKAHARDIRDYVAAGGRYLGFCLGGYLAGSSPGFGLLPGDADQYIGSPDATVDTEDDTVVRVLWRDRARCLYFQDGPFFSIRPKARGVTVLATYPNALPAALIARRGAGWVGVVGPHPEATANWYDEYDLENPDGIDFGPAHDLLDTLIRA